jgi:hypothetical protein
MSAFLSTHSREKKWNELFLFVQDVLKENEELKEQNRSLWRMLHLEPEMMRRENNKPLPRRRVSRSEDEVTFLFERRSQLRGEEGVGKFSVNGGVSSCKSWDFPDNRSELTPGEISKMNSSVVSELTIPQHLRRRKAAITRAALEMAPPPCSQYGKRRWKDSVEMNFVKEVNEIIEKNISVGEMQEQREVAKNDKIEEKNDETIKHIVFLDDVRNDICANPGEIKNEEEQMEDKEDEEKDEEQIEQDEECEDEEQIEEEQMDKDEECQQEDEQIEQIEQIEEDEECEQEEEQIEQEEEDEECEQEEEEQEEEDEVEEIIYKGKKYYKDNRNTIYSIDADEEVGPEIGKYNPQTQSIEFYEPNK